MEINLTKEELYMLEDALRDIGSEYFCEDSDKYWPLLNKIKWYIESCE